MIQTNSLENVGAANKDVCVCVSACVHAMDLCQIFICISNNALTMVTR